MLAVDKSFIKRIRWWWWHCKQLCTSSLSFGGGMVPRLIVTVAGQHPPPQKKVLLKWRHCLTFDRAPVQILRSSQRPPSVRGWPTKSVSYFPPQQQDTAQRRHRQHGKRRRCAEQHGLTPGRPSPRNDGNSRIGMTSRRRVDVPHIQIVKCSLPNYEKFRKAIQRNLFANLCVEKTDGVILKLFQKKRIFNKACILLSLVR